MKDKIEIKPNQIVFHYRANEDLELKRPPTKSKRIIVPLIVHC